MKRKIGTLQLCMVAMAVVINIIGANLALMLKLPLLLDSMGTLIIGALLGPFYGMLPSLLSGILLGVTTDIYSLYFAPSGMLTGFMAGMILKRRVFGKQLFPVEALIICLPGAALSSAICVQLFGGVTSSISTVFVQLLGKTPLGLFVGAFVVQVTMEYFDRMIGILLAKGIVRALPMKMLERLNPEKGREKKDGNSRGTL